MACGAPRMRAHTILFWSMVSATVGQLIRTVETRAGWAGRLLMGFAGLGWGMATYLVVPVLVMEDAGVMDSVRRSASLLRGTWGEQLVSGLAFGWLGLLWAIPGIVLGALGANGYPIFIVPAVLWFAAMMAAFTAASEIFTVALYRYATTGEAPSGYDAGNDGRGAAAALRWNRRNRRVGGGCFHSRRSPATANHTTVTATALVPRGHTMLFGTEGAIERHREEALPGHGLSSHRVLWFESRLRLDP